jgi:hypothetical protein
LGFADAAAACLVSSCVCAGRKRRNRPTDRPPPTHTHTRRPHCIIEPQQQAAASEGLFFLGSLLTHSLTHSLTYSCREAESVRRLSVCVAVCPHLPPPPFERKKKQMHASVTPQPAQHTTTTGGSILLLPAPDRHPPPPSHTHTRTPPTTHTQTEEGTEAPTTTKSSSIRSSKSKQMSAFQPVKERRSPWPMVAGECQACVGDVCGGDGMGWGRIVVRVVCVCVTWVCALFCVWLM